MVSPSSLGDYTLFNFSPPVSLGTYLFLCFLFYATPAATIQALFPLRPLFPLSDMALLFVA